MNRVLDIAEMRRETDTQVARSYMGAEREWREAALEIVRDTCEEYEEFTVNDVRARVDLLPFDTHDRRAMGGVMQRAKLLGWIEPTGRSIPSRVGHMVHIQIWRSKIRRDPENTRLGL